MNVNMMDILTFYTSSIYYKMSGMFETISEIVGNPYPYPNPKGKIHLIFLKIKLVSYSNILMQSNPKNTLILYLEVTMGTE